MNTKWKVILSMMVLIIAICSVFFTVLERQQSKAIDKLIQNKSENVKQLAETILSNMAKGYKKRIVGFTNPKLSPSRQQLIQAFADRDREKVFKLSSLLFKVLAKETPYFKSIGWILPNNEVFLRVQDPKKHGDNVGTLRHDVAAVNRDRVQNSGFHPGIKGVQYRVVQPVFYNDTYLGAVQFGLDAGIIYDTLMETTGMVSGIAMTNEVCEVIQTPPEPIFRSDTHIIKSPAVDIIATLQGQLDWNNPQQQVIIDGKPQIILNVLPVNDFQNKELGMFFVVMDISQELLHKRRLLTSIIIISAILIFLSFLILYFSYGGLVQKIINLNKSLENHNLELEDKIHERTIELHENKEQLQRILDNAPLGILITGASDRKFQYANPAICTMLGYDSDELPAMAVDQVHPTDFLPQAIDILEKQAEGTNRTSVDIPFQRKDGTSFEADIISARFSVDEETSIIWFILDRTELKKLGEQLLRAQKMESIGLMAGGVAHDLNNILSGIINYPELMLHQLPEESALRAPLIAIQESGRRAATVVADLLTVARGAASTREPHDIHLLIEEYLNSPEFTTLQAEYGSLQCVSHLDAVQSIISCSPIHINKALMNLVTNSVEASDGNCDIIITTRNEEIHDTDISDDALAPGPYLVLSVKDNGEGISPTDLTHIFEPFYTKKVMGKSGTGLGLAVVWNTIQDHKGKIVVESDEQGTLFQLYFPVSDKTPKHLEDPKKYDIKSQENEHLLVVDDEAQLRDIAKAIAKSLGYRVDAVASGEEAIEFVKQQAVDLIILDMLMEPGLNGKETYEKILEIYPKQKAIITSGYSKSDDVKTALRKGAGKYIKKPYTTQELGLAIKEALQN